MTWSDALDHILLYKFKNSGSLSLFWIVSPNSKFSLPFLVHGALTWYDFFHFYFLFFTFSPLSGNIDIDLTEIFCQSVLGLRVLMWKIRIMKFGDDGICSWNIDSENMGYCFWRHQESFSIFSHLLGRKGKHKNHSFQRENILQRPPK